MKHNVLILEAEELLDFDMRTGNIKVDKSIFDDFMENYCIQIHFVEDDAKSREDRVVEYKMIAEDENGIFMEYLGEVN